MPRNDSIKLSRVPTTTPKKFIEVNVFWNANRRQYVMSVTPVEVKDGFVSFVMTHMQFATIEQGTRFNQKRMDTLAAMAESTEMFTTLVGAVAAKHGLDLVTETATAEQQAA